MRTSSDIQKKIQTTFESLDSINQVKVSPFFKDKTMNLLFAEREVAQPTFWSWLTPHIQLALLIGFIVLNAFAFMNVNSNTYDDSVNEFADSYGLSVESEFSALN
ncbi:MAG: hypothetical protein ACSHXF_12790 [Aquaticitalea sp.]